MDSVQVLGADTIITSAELGENGTTRPHLNTDGQAGASGMTYVSLC